MGLLDGGLKAVFGGAFGSIMLPGTLYRPTRTDSAGGTPTVTWTAFRCRGQVDAVTEAMRTEAGYTDRDVRIILLQEGLTVTPTTDFEAAIGGRRWKVASVDSDPASTHWIMRGTPA